MRLINVAGVRRTQFLDFRFERCVFCSKFRRVTWTPCHVTVSREPCHVSRRREGWCLNEWLLLKPASVSSDSSFDFMRERSRALSTDEGSIAGGMEGLGGVGGGGGEPNRDFLEIRDCWKQVALFRSMAL